MAKSEFVCVRMENRLKNAAGNQAAKIGVSRSNLIRQAVEEFLSRLAAAEDNPTRDTPTAAQTGRQANNNPRRRNSEQTR